MIKQAGTHHNFRRNRKGVKQKYNLLAPYRGISGRLWRQRDAASHAIKDGMTSVSQYGIECQDHVDFRKGRKGLLPDLALSSPIPSKQVREG